MATDFLNKYSVDLSLKLRDPVNTHNADGSIWFSLPRLGYLNRAYGKLYRFLSAILDPPSLEQIFPMTMQIVNYVYNPDSPTTLVDLDSNPIDCSKIIPGYVTTNVINIYVPKETAQGDTNKQIARADVESYFSGKYGLTTDNAHYKADSNAKKYFFSLINEQIVFTTAGLQANSLVMLVKAPIRVFKHDDGPDIYIPNHLLDIYFSLAALEAMLDEGSEKSILKANAYRQEIAEAIKFIFDTEAYRKRNAIENTVR